MSVPEPTRPPLGSAGTSSVPSRPDPSAGDRRVDVRRLDSGDPVAEGLEGFLTVLAGALGGTVLCALAWRRWRWRRDDGG